MQTWTADRYVVGLQRIGYSLKQLIVFCVFSLHTHFCFPLKEKNESKINSLTRAIESNSQWIFNLPSQLVRHHFIKIILVAAEYRKILLILLSRLENSSMQSCKIIDHYVCSRHLITNWSNVVPYCASS